MPLWQNWLILNLAKNLSQSKRTKSKEEPKKAKEENRKPKKQRKKNPQKLFRKKWKKLR